MIRSALFVLIAAAPFQYAAAQQEPTSQAPEHCAVKLAGYYVPRVRPVAPQPGEPKFMTEATNAARVFMDCIETQDYLKANETLFNKVFKGWLQRVESFSCKQSSIDARRILHTACYASSMQKVRLLGTAWIAETAGKVSTR